MGFLSNLIRKVRGKEKWPSLGGSGGYHRMSGNWPPPSAGAKSEGGGAYASTLKVTSMREKKPPDVKSLLLRLKRELRKRGGEGLIAINRKFKIMDDDGSGTLNLAEFKKAMGEMNLPDTGLELKALFEHFDADGSGALDRLALHAGLPAPAEKSVAALWYHCELKRPAPALYPEDYAGPLPPVSEGDSLNGLFDDIFDCDILKL